MRKTVISLFLVLVMLTTAAMPIFAEESEPVAVQSYQTDDGSTIVCFDDGSTLTISVAYTEENSISTYATTKTSSKDATYKDADGVLQWKYTLTGTFSYTSGVSSTCTKASYTYNIYESGWSFSDGAATKSGNKATGTGVFKLKVLFVTLQTYNINISLTCDTYGNVT